MASQNDQESGNIFSIITSMKQTGEDSDKNMDKCQDVSTTNVENEVGGESVSDGNISVHDVDLQILKVKLADVKIKIEPIDDEFEREGLRIERTELKPKIKRPNLKKCTICGKSFRKARFTRMHVKKKHPEESSDSVKTAENNDPIGDEVHPSNPASEISEKVESEVDVGISENNSVQPCGSAIESVGSTSKNKDLNDVTNGKATDSTVLEEKEIGSVKAEEGDSDETESLDYPYNVRQDNENVPVLISDRGNKGTNTGTGTDFHFQNVVDVMVDKSYEDLDVDIESSMDDNAGVSSEHNEISNINQQAAQKSRSRKQELVVRKEFDEVDREENIYKKVYKRKLSFDDQVAVLKKRPLLLSAFKWRSPHWQPFVLLENIATTKLTDKNALEFLPAPAPTKIIDRHHGTSASIPSSTDKQFAASKAIQLADWVEKQRSEISPIEVPSEDPTSTNAGNPVVIAPDSDEEEEVEDDFDEDDPAYANMTSIERAQVKAMKTSGQSWIGDSREKRNSQTPSPPVNTTITASVLGTVMVAPSEKQAKDTVQEIVDIEEEDSDTQLEVMDFIREVKEATPSAVNTTKGPTTTPAPDAVEITQAPITAPAPDAVMTAQAPITAPAPDAFMTTQVPTVSEPISPPAPPEPINKRVVQETPRAIQMQQQRVEKLSNFQREIARISDALLQLKNAVDEDMTNVNDENLKIQLQETPKKKTVEKPTVAADKDASKLTTNANKLTNDASKLTTDASKLTTPSWLDSTPILKKILQTEKVPIPGLIQAAKSDKKPESTVPQPEPVIILDESSNSSEESVMFVEASSIKPTLESKQSDSDPLQEALAKINSNIAMLQKIDPKDESAQPAKPAQPKQAPAPTSVKEEPSEDGLQDALAKINSDIAKLQNTAKSVVSATHTEPEVAASLPEEPQSIYMTTSQIELSASKLTESVKPKPIVVCPDNPVQRKNESSPKKLTIPYESFASAANQVTSAASKNRLSNPMILVPAGTSGNINIVVQAPSGTSLSIPSPPASTSSSGDGSNIVIKKEADGEGESDPNKIGCHLCTKEFVDRNSLRRHMLIHEGVKHPCDICNKTFSQMADMRRHRRIHTGEKPYACDFCSKSFMTAWSLKLHRMTHTGERPHQCSICGRGFKQRNQMRQHERLHTTGGRVAMYYCPNTSSN